ncbi:hypothetical protein LTR62_004906 [Meristemomyces frigidus]|uniref:Uncharacterized protein n=1 Tax=Meristemomyces frigidus TaxID=1508187 RepID=A0AAN7TLD8_9PEZI|nr:hypothetical protein LTR62_004906 [Meristemomyces frigidus]
MPTPSAVEMTATITASQESRDDRMFDEKITRMRKYLAEEMRCRSTERPPDEKAELHKRKNVLLVKYDMIGRAQQQLPRRIAYTAFWARMALSVLLGFFLNTNFAMLSLPGALIFLVVVGYDLSNMIGQVYGMVSRTETST